MKLASISKTRVLAISGSPSPTSKTALVTEYILKCLREHDVEVHHVRLSDIDGSALLKGDMSNVAIGEMVAKLQDAHGVLVATPIFKAAYSGLLKAALDILPQFALAGKVVLPLGTGGSVAHVLALDYALRPVLQSMGARHVVQAHFICEKDIDVKNVDRLLPEEADQPLRAAVMNFTHSLTAASEARLLGHPRPPIPLELVALADEGRR